MQETTTLYWIRRDFRFEDNAALAAAIRAGEAVLPVFLLEEGGDPDWPLGGAARWWLHRALEAAAAEWRQRGGQLVIRPSPDPLQSLLELCRESGALRVAWNRRYEPRAREVDAVVKRGLRDAGIEVSSYQDALLVEPHTIGTGDGKPYKVYTPFWKTCQSRTLEKPIKVPLDNLRFPAAFPLGESVDALALLPKLSWYKNLAEHWQIGERPALEQMRAFINKGASDYSDQRDLPAVAGTSRLSPYLHWGHVGPRTLADALQSAHNTEVGGPLVYLKELFWREFAYNVLYHFPHTPTDPLRPEFAAFPWQSDANLLQCWQRGETGYPMIDAGMRELYATGWMHNRVRMVVASFLVKHLLQPWQEGARWFWDTLVDADLASNTLGWQWSGGCGADAAPYFRVFNPILQSRKFDADGDYLRRWLPELEQLPTEHLHVPWEAPANVLQRAGIALGKDYPTPVIEHGKGRDRALEAFAQFKQP